MQPNAFQQQQQLQQQRNRNMMGFYWMKKKKEEEQARRQAKSPGPGLPGLFPGTGLRADAAVLPGLAHSAPHLTPATHPVKAVLALLFWFVVTLAVVVGLKAVRLQPLAGAVAGLAGLVLTVGKTVRTYRGD